MQSAPDASHSTPQHKGKATRRSWPQLPPELIRLIATHYLWDLALTSYCPQTWENRRLWPSRMVWTCIRDSLNLEKHVMTICPEWHRAIATHPFWRQAITLLDSNDSLLHHMVIYPKPQQNASSNTIPHPIYLTPYQHLRNILNSSCHVCRINYPLSNAGLTTAKRSLSTSLLGTVHLCREHDRRRGNFCGLCLRDSFVPNHQDSTTRDYELSQSIAILENEDENTWPGVESTCKKCRVEWLWRRANNDPRDREAIGGHTMTSDDWETRQCVEGFVELAEGSIEEVMRLAREKHWLKRYTKYESLGQHALAAQKTHSVNDEQEEEEEEDSEEEKELMLMKDANQVREMALNDWARRVILDGHWVCPADVWYGVSVPGQPASVPAIHPCPWAREVHGEPSSDEEEEHPLGSIVTGDIPPTYSLCNQAYIAFVAQIHEILAHPFRNIVRKIVMECNVPTEKGYEDPAIKVARMSLEDVITILREEEGVWYDGVDWIERKRNEQETTSRRRVEGAEAEAAAAVQLIDKDRHRKEDDSDSTTSSSSSSARSRSAKSSNQGSSNATSPVLSTTTLQTTPSPPPLSDEGARTRSSKKDEDATQQERELPSRPRIIPVDPVRSPPQLLSSIPYVPVTIAHLPKNSFEAIEKLWRDVCAPLYHCRCSLCERAKAAEAAARAAEAALNSAAVSVEEPVQQTLRTTIYPAPTVIRSNDHGNVDTGEIILKEVNEVELDGEGEEEVDYATDASDLEYEEDDEEDDEDDPRYEVDEDDYRYSASPGVQPAPPRTRKRSCDELEEQEERAEEYGDGVDDDDATVNDSPFFRRPDRRGQGGTPPKRARLGDRVALPAPEEEEQDAAGDANEDENEDLTTHLQPVNPTPSSPARLRKRSSEELEDGAEHEHAMANKRVKVDRSASLVESPVSLASDLEGEGEERAYSPVADEVHAVEDMVEEVEDKSYMPPSMGRRRVYSPQMDTLLALQDGED